MVISDVLSPAMTSASPKIHPTILNQHDIPSVKSTEMPVCVAAAFSHNDLYKTNGVRALSEVSSPETLSYEHCTPSYQHCVRSPSNDSVEKSEHSQDSESEGAEIKPSSVMEENELRNLGKFAALYNNHLTLLNRFQSLNPEKYPSAIERQATSLHQDFSPMSVDNEDDIQNNNNNSNNPEVKQKISAIVTNEYSPTSPFAHKSMHPLKRRVLFGSSPPRDVSKSQSDTGIVERSPTTPGKDKKILQVAEGSLLHSSDILRQMYAAFGAVPEHVGSNVPTEMARWKRKAPTAGTPSPDAEQEPKTRRRSADGFGSSPISRGNRVQQLAFRSLNDAKGTDKSCHDFYGPVRGDEPTRHVTKRRKGEAAESPDRKRSRNDEVETKRENERLRPTLDETHQATVPPPLRLNVTAFHPLKGHKVPSKNAHVRSKGLNDIDLKQQLSSRCGAESATNTPDTTDCEEDVLRRDQRRSSSLERKTRHASAESAESTGTNPMKTLYGTNAPMSFPYGHHLPFNLGAFGISGLTGSLGVSGLPHANPLQPAANPFLLATNPYIANQYLLREMLNRSSMASPLFPTPGFGLPLFPGMSLEQIQALQHLQSNAMFPSLLGQSFPSLEPHFPSRAFGGNSSMQKSRDTVSPPDHSNGAAALQTNGLSEAIRNTSHDYVSPTNEAALVGRRNLLHTQHHSKSDKQPKKSDSRRSFAGGPQSLPVEALVNKHSKTSSLFRTTRNERKRHERKPTDKSKHKPQDSLDRKAKPLHREITIDAALSEGHTKTAVDDDTESNICPTNGGISATQKPSGYKNLTRERRLVANARERTRVHTISSAFDELRAQVPSYSCNQKLSKLAILRIACSYIRTLSVLAGKDDSTSFAQGVDQCTKVLQAESRARSRRKSNKAQIEWEMVNYERQKSTEDNLKNATSRPRSDSDATDSLKSKTTFTASPNANKGDDHDFSSTYSFDVCNDVTDAADVSTCVADETYDSVGGGDVDVETVEESKDPLRKTVTSETDSSPVKLLAGNGLADPTASSPTPSNEISSS